MAKAFWGRVELEAVCAFYYFNKNGRVQQLIHHIKYKGHKEAAITVGQLFGEQLKTHPLYCSIDLIVPVPLHKKKEQQRGYNQSYYFALGMATAMKKTVDRSCLTRIQGARSQTRKNRFNRWTNVAGSFRLTSPETITNKHILLIDDVFTTGATLEACSQALLQGAHTKVSIATIACASNL